VVQMSLVVAGALCLAGDPLGRNADHELLAGNVTDWMIYNGSDGGGPYHLGLAVSTDGGWEFEARANPVLDPGPPGSWDDLFVVQPSVVKLDNEWVMFYAGSDGAIRQIGRATSQDLVHWTKDPSNPVLRPGIAGAFDGASVNVPHVLFEQGRIHPWQMWYTGWTTSTADGTGIGYAYSDDGRVWVKSGPVLLPGAVGEFDDEGLVTGATVRPAEDSYALYYTGYHAGRYHSGYATTDDPANPGAYVKSGPLVGLDGDVDVGGVRYGSNHLYSTVPSRGLDILYLTVFHSGDGTEATAVSWARTIGGNVATPLAGPVIPLGSGWDANSAENAFVVLP
jgi:hypothetical protein